VRVFLIANFILTRLGDIDQFMHIDNLKITFYIEPRKPLWVRLEIGGNLPTYFNCLILFFGGPEAFLCKMETWYEPFCLL